MKRGRRRQLGVDGVDGEAWMKLGHVRLSGDLHGKMER
jgi:hypothetical protein